jgi:hypothetical protein
MNRKLFALLATCITAASCFPAEVYPQGFGGPEGGDSGSAPEKAAPKPRIRWQQPLKLPEQYRARDKDKDGQIGLYEWDRKDFATFRKLDLNHDGFLTAEELTRKPSSRPSAAVATAPGGSPAKPAGPPSPVAGTASDSSPASASEAPATASTEKPAAPKGDAPAAAAAAPASGTGRSEAERQFEDVLDKDKDGTVTEAEWGRSFLVKKKFNDAGIAVTFPLTREEFIQLYSQLPGTGK